MAFAVSGAAVAIRADMDWLGVAVPAAVTAVGGTPLALAAGASGPVAVLLGVITPILRAR